MKNYFTCLKPAMAAMAPLLSKQTVAQRTLMQTNDSVMQINRRYKTEIGVDMSGLLQKTPGTAVILKIKKKNSRFVDLRSAKNYRIQASINGTVPINEKTQQTDTTFTRYATKAEETINVALMVGLERVNFFGRFNFYYGVDVGPYYNYSSSSYLAYSYNNYYGAYANTPFQTEAEKKGLAAMPFIGAKFRFSEHFSASIESGFAISYYLGSQVISTLPYYGTVSNNSLRIAKTTSSGVDFSMKYLRFLTLNYHL